MCVYSVFIIGVSNVLSIPACEYQRIWPAAYEAEETGSLCLLLTVRVLLFRLKADKEDKT